MSETIMLMDSKPRVINKILLKAVITAYYFIEHRPERWSEERISVLTELDNAIDTAQKTMEREAVKP